MRKAWWWQLGWAWIVLLVLLHGCRSSASEPAAQAAATQSEARPAVCSPSRRAPIRDRDGFVEALRTLQSCNWSVLTPRAIANAFGANVRASESAGSWEFDTNGELLAVSAEAAAEDAPATSVHISPKLDLGVTMALMEALYGSRYDVLPPGK